MRLGLGSVRQWHWISSAGCLVCMLLFAITGITLNHATDIKVTPEVTSLETSLPQSILVDLKTIAQQEDTEAELPASLTFWLQQTHSISVSKHAVAQWSEDELYVVQAGPGFDTWFAVDFISNELSYENTDRGVIAYLNDLHKGRDTGVVWGWFLDVFSVACIVFCLTGLLLLYRQTNHRWMTWPVTILGAIIPAIILLVFVH